ncbi:MAG: hypothetical protein IJI47_01510 [Eubacterium sp.]|nr:hypothetical protein [Eubacterium sp.]
MKAFKKIMVLILPLAVLVCALTGFGVNAFADGGLDLGGESGMDFSAGSVSLSANENIVSHYSLNTSMYKAMGGVSYQYSYNNGDTQEKQTITSEVIPLGDASSINIDVEQAAAQISEPVTIDIFDEGGSSISTLTYKAKDYCDAVISMDAEELAQITTHGAKLQKLCKAIVAYSKSSQGVFTDYMAQAGSVAISDDYSADLDFANADYANSYSKTNGDNVRFSTASFMCESSAKMRFYIAVANESDPTVYDDPDVTLPEGATYVKGTDGAGKYFFQVNDIKPVDFDEQITINYAGASITMSVLDYAGVVIGSSATTSQLKTLAKSLIRYNETAQAFFEAPQTVYVPAKAATCTETGNEACYEFGGKYYSDAEAENEIAFPVIAMTAHSYGEYVQTKAPTCTAKGEETRTCSVCGATDNRDVDALGHTYNAVVTNPTCTAGGYTTYTCTNCNDSYTGDSTAALGHTDSWAVTNGATTTATGTETNTCSVCGASLGTRTVQTFSLKFPNTEDYLYRIGNSNAVKLGQLFDNASGASITGVSATVTKNTGTATGTFTANASDWRESTIKFNNTGVVTVTLKHGTTTAATLKLEVVAGTNRTSLSGSVGNTVLLNDVAITSGITVSGSTLYGNGFTVDATGTADSSGNTTLGSLSGCINLSSGTLNNVKVIGPNFKNAAVFQTTDSNCVFTVKTAGECYIYNSYLFGSRATIGTYGTTATSNLTVENTVLDGGRYSNIFHRFGKLNLHNVTTINQPRTTLNGDVRCGYGIVISDEATADEQVTATGYLKQYNWIGRTTDEPYFKGDNSASTSNTAVETLFTNMFSKATALTVTYNNQKYINTGILSLGSAAPHVTGEAVSDYSAVSVSLSSNTGWAMAPTSLDADTPFANTKDFKYYAATEYSPSTQPPTIPTFTWSYPSTYSSTEKQVNLSFTSGDSVSFNPSILAATKYGNNLTVSTAMGGSAVSNPINFNTAGDYTITYTITDPYNYAADGTTATSRTYTKTLNVHVTETVASIKAPVFTFKDTSNNSLATKIVDVNGKHYVTVDTTTASDTVKASGVSGVYCPVVTVQFKDNSSDFNYLFPIFTGVNITNYTDTAGNSTTYTKSSNLSALPSGLVVVSSDPNWNGKTSFNSYEKNSTYGLIAKSAAIGSNQSARNATIEYKFTAGNGEEYYYRLYFSAAAHNKPSGCVAEGSLVTMADGTKKAIDDVQQGDVVMTWSFWNGRYEAMPVGIKWYHGTKDWDVLTLNFSDGTSVRTINEHGFFDVDKNTYAYIVPDNVGDYVGDRFIKQAPDGSSVEVTLDSYSLTTENVGCYSLQTVRNDNFIVEDMLSITAEENFPGKFEFFEVGEGMKYDEANMQAEIAKHGLYTYDEWADYLTEEQFYALNGPYYKILVGRGVLTEDELINIIEVNVN